MHIRYPIMFNFKKVQIINTNEKLYLCKCRVIFFFAQGVIQYCAEIKNKQESKKSTKKVIKKNRKLFLFFLGRFLGRVLVFLISFINSHLYYNNLNLVIFVLPLPPQRLPGVRAMVRRVSRWTPCWTRQRRRHCAQPLDPQQWRRHCQASSQHRRRCHSCWVVGRRQHDPAGWCRGAGCGPWGWWWTPWLAPGTPSTPRQRSAARPATGNLIEGLEVSYGIVFLNIDKKESRWNDHNCTT